MRVLVWLSAIGIVVLVALAVLGPSLPEGNPFNGLGTGVRDIGVGIAGSLGDIGRGIGDTFGGIGD